VLTIFTSLDFTKQGNYCRKILPSYYIVATLCAWILHLLVTARRPFLIKRRIRNIKFVGICWTNNIIVTAGKSFRSFNNRCAPRCLLGVVIRLASQYLCRRYYFTGGNKYSGPSFSVRKLLVCMPEAFRSQITQRRFRHTHSSVSTGQRNSIKIWL